MKLLTEDEVSKALQALGRVRGLEWTVKQPSERRVTGSGNYGQYRFRLAGAVTDKTAVHTGDWGGGCFASWRSIPPTHMVEELSYNNPLPNKSIPRGAMKFCKVAWDSVIQPCFHQFLPPFAELRTTRSLVFDTTQGSWLEPSMYWRLARVWNECMDFVRNAGLLAYKYPEAPVPVLLAATTLNKITLEGGLTENVLSQTPNTTIHSYCNIQFAASLVRNFEWAARTGRWEVTQLTRQQGLISPFTRQFHGHNPFWYGRGTKFKVRLFPQNVPERLLQRAQGPSLIPFNESNGWRRLDDVMAVLQQTYDITVDKEPAQWVTLNIRENERYDAFLNLRPAQPARLY